VKDCLCHRIGRRSRLSVSSWHSQTKSTSEYQVRVNVYVTCYLIFSSLMPRPVLRAVLRSKPPRPYLRTIRFRYKPFPQKEQVVWGFAAFRFLRHIANLRPDAYVCLSDLVGNCTCFGSRGLILMCRRMRHLCRIRTFIKSWNGS